MKPKRAEVIGFMETLLDKSKKQLKFREESVKCFSEGTDDEWAAAAKLHPSTKGKPLSHLERLRLANANLRIAQRVVDQINMLETAISMLKEEAGK